MTRKEVKEMVRELLNSEVKTVDANINGNKTTQCYRRIIRDGLEYTLVGNTTDFTGAYLYIGEIGATISRLKEGRKEMATIEGEQIKWASLYANKIRNENDLFYTFG